LNIPSGFSGIITNKEKYYAKLGDMAVMALNDGCTKTNPIIPSIDDLIELFKKVY